MVDKASSREKKKKNIVMKDFKNFNGREKI